MEDVRPEPGAGRPPEAGSDAARATGATASGPGPSGTRRRALVVVIAGFVVSRLVFLTAGIQFDVSGLPWYWQFLDLHWLQHDLARSLLYLHAQPPFMNAIVGLSLKYAGPHWVGALDLLFLATGLALALALFDLLARLGLSDRAAAAVALLYSCSPTAALYENWFMYTHLVSSFSVCAAWALFHLVATRRGVYAAIFFALIGSLALMRSLFHLVWLVPCAAIAWVATRPLRAPVLAWSAAAFAVVLGVYAKNFWIFGLVATSSWFGMNLAHGVLAEWPLEDRQAPVLAGEASPIILVQPFSPIEKYPESYQKASPVDVDALAEHGKTNRITNYNQYSYLALSEQYGRDALALVRADPWRYAAMVGRAWRRYATSPTSFPMLGANRERLRGWIRLESMLRGVPAAFRAPRPARATRGPHATPGWDQVGFVWLAAVCAGLAVAAREVWTTVRAVGPARALASPRIAVLAFVLFDVAFVSVAANAVELGENERFRVAIEPLLVVLVAVAAQRLFGRRRETTRPARA